METPAPRQLSHYTLDRQLGRGGMGAVYRGTDRRDGSVVAVKLMHPHLAEDPLFRERFTREAHVAALLRSPYTVQLVDYGLDQGHYYLAMEFVEGTNLRAELRSGPLPLRRTLHIGIQVARALEEADARGVVHRDVKPENILLTTNDQVKVTDFGIARQQNSSRLTLTGNFVGTPVYAAPEQLRGEADHRSDVYALGAVLFECLTGRPPRVMLQDTFSMPQAEALPPAVAGVLRAAIQHDPADRIQHASDLRAALEQLERAEADGSLATLAPNDVVRPATTQAGATERVSPAATRGGASGALAGTLGLRLSLARNGPFGGRFRAATYELVVENHGTAPMTVSFATSDEGRALALDLPDRMTIAPHAAETTPVQVRPRKRRWFGRSGRHRFTVSAAEGVGPPIATVSGTFDERPFGMLPIGGGLLAVGVVAAVVAALLFGGGGSGTPAGPDETETEAVTETEAAGTETEAPTRELAATPTATPTLRTVALPTPVSTPRPGLPTATPTATPAPPTATATPTAIAPPPPTSTPTAGAPPNSILSGEWNYAFYVVENTCPAGLAVGTFVPAVFTLLETVPDDAYLSPGEAVNVYDFNGNFLDTYAFTYPRFEISYLLIEGGAATLSQDFFTATSGSAVLVEAYDTPDGVCFITFDE